jgi:hypothetical protein
VATCQTCHKPAQEQSQSKEEATETPTSTPTTQKSEGKATPAASATPAAGPPAIPHTLAGRDNCLMCHDLGQAVPFPADHEGRTVATCQTCHKPAQEQSQSKEEATETPIPTPTAQKSEQKATPAASATPAAGPPAIPHTLAGRDNCLMCHDLGQAVPFPTDHKGRTVATCQTCHKPAQADE